jgi:hypothetical protein
MKLLSTLAAGLALYALYSLLQAETNYRQRLLRQFRCWLCKRPTIYLPSAQPQHHDCSYCGISNKVLPGAEVGQLPDVPALIA